MLTVEVCVNNKRVAFSSVANVTETSDPTALQEYSAQVATAPYRSGDFQHYSLEVKGHHPDDNVWPLIARLALAAARREGFTGKLED